MKTESGITLAVLAVSLVVILSLHFAMSHSGALGLPAGVSGEITSSIPAR
ncbi:hypothetical protein [Pararhizobium antarcticum]|nr:hypothetical protein [Pararhizobium antarcticum]